MAGYLSIVLHAHLPFVRHPEHERFLEESWLYEAVTECYLPLMEILRGWQRDGIKAALTLTLSPTLCAMLLDSLLQARYRRRLEGLIELAEKEILRNHWQPNVRAVAEMYRARFLALREIYASCGGDLVAAFRQWQADGFLEIITCAATHAILPLLAAHPEAVRAQVRVARDHYGRCFGREPAGFWLPECAYTPALESALGEGGFEWFILEAHGLLHANPRPLQGLFAPVFTPGGLAAFGRDIDSARQVWSRHAGYPGDFRYREFYRDIGFDLDFDYIQPYLPAPRTRGFTGLKYHAITGTAGDKRVYERETALAAAHEHARHFVQGRREHLDRLAAVMSQPPLILAPYDAELFGHWWFEGPEFLDQVIRLAARQTPAVTLITPTQYLRRHPVQQASAPSASSWGEAGYWRVWLNEENAWIYPQLLNAQETMIQLAGEFAMDPSQTRPSTLTPQPPAVVQRALDLAANELLLAQASDWPFQIRSGQDAAYARQRLTDHLERFRWCAAQLRRGQIDTAALANLEAVDLVFPGAAGYYRRPDAAAAQPI